MGMPSGRTNNFLKMWAWRGLASRSFQWVTWRLTNVVFVGCTVADRRTLGDERRLTGAIVCVITKSAILISAQFNIAALFVHCPNHLVYCEAVRSAILATAWLLVFTVHCSMTELRRNAHKMRNVARTWCCTASQCCHGWSSTLWTAAGHLQTDSPSPLPRPVESCNSVQLSWTSQELHAKRNTT